MHSLGQVRDPDQVPAAVHVAVAEIGPTDPSLYPGCMQKRGVKNAVTQKYHHTFRLYINLNLNFPICNWHTLQLTVQVEPYVVPVHDADAVVVVSPPVMDVTAKVGHELTASMNTSMTRMRPCKT